MRAMTTLIGLSEFHEIDALGMRPTVSTKAIHQEIVARTGKKHPKVLYLPTAKNDREDYIDFFRQYYLDLGCSEVDALLLLKNPPSGKEISDKIFSADIIYVNGGNSHRMLATWKRLGVDKLLQQAHEQGIIMSGHSAGLVCWFSYACSNSFYTNKPFRLTGMGVYSAVVCPHYDSEPFRRPALKKIMKRTPGLVAIAFDDGTAIEIVDDTYRLLKIIDPAKARRTFWKEGKYIIEEIKSSEKFKSLRGLLEKP